MNIERSHALYTYLSAFWAFVMLALFAELHAPAVILFLSFFFLGVFKGRLRIPISSAFWLLVSIVVLVSALYGWFVIQERLYSVVYLFLYLEINKIWTAEKDRDILQLYGLTFFQVLAASVSTSSIWFAPALALYMFLILGALITFTLKRDAEASLDPRGLRRRLAGAPDPATKEESHALARLEGILATKYLTPRFGRWLTMTLTFVMVIGGALFFIIPRLAAQSFLSSYTPHTGAQLTSGFSDSVEFSGMGEIQTDPTIAMRVIPGRGFPRNADGPSIDVLRLRGTALDNYDGRRWSKGKQVSEGLSVPERKRQVVFHPDPAHNNPASAFEAVIQLEPNRKGFLFGPDRTMTFDFAEKDMFFLQVDPVSESVQANIANWVSTLKYTTQCALPLDRWWEMENIQSPNPAEAMLVQFRKAWNLPEDEHDMGGLESVLRPAFLELPAVKDMDTVRTLAEEWTGKETSPYKIATTIESNLKRGYQYSLNVDFSRRPDHLTRFLTVEKAGHCEYFATAMTLMLRARGIPARIVNGYATDEWVQAGGGYYIVRQEHAHSWVEAYFANKGWMTFDPTPYNGIGANRIPMTLYRWMTRWVDRLKFFWYDNVIDYDVTDQRFMFHLLFRAMDMFDPHTVFRTPGGFSLNGQSMANRKIFFISLIAIGAGVMLIVMLREIRHLVKRKEEKKAVAAGLHGRGPAIVIEDYLRLLRALEERFSRSPAETPLEYATAVIAKDTAMQDLPPLTQRYYDARFHESLWSETETERVNALLRLLRETGDKKDQPGTAPKIS